MEPCDGEQGITRLAQFWWGLMLKGQGEVAEEDRQAAQRCRGHWAILWPLLECPEVI